MKLIKSVVLGSLALLALACDRGNNNIQREEAGSVQSRDNWQGNAEVEEEGFREGADLSQGTSRGSGAIATPHSQKSPNAGAGAAAGAAYEDQETGGGSGATTGDELDDEGNDQWKNDDDGAGTGSGSGSSDSDDNRYLDNTSSEADLNQQDRGIPIGREPSRDNTDNSSSESDEDAQTDL